jgi:signal transduction histidine kinase/uncharacterized protein HemY
MKQFILFFSLWWLLGQVGFAQNLHTIDSLTKILKNNLTDTREVDIYNLLAKEYKKIDSTTKTCKLQLIHLSNKVNYPIRQAKAWYCIGGVAKTKGHYSQALIFFERSKQIAKKNHYKKGVMNAWNHIGHNYYLQGNYFKAKEAYQNMLNICKQINDKRTLAKGYVNIGAIYHHLGHYSKALEAYQYSLKTYTKMKSKKGIALACINIGYIYDYQNNNAIAMLFFKRSIKLYKEIGNQGKVADGYIALGGAYQKKERYTKASNYYQQALKIETQLKDELGVSDCYLELGKLALVQKKHKKGQYYLEKALQIKKKLNTNTSLSETEMYLGSIFYHKRNFIEAKSYFNKAIETALKMGNPTIVRDASEYLTKVYEVLGQYKKALKYHRLFKKMTDSLLNKENIQQITRLESKVITQKREDSLKIIQEKKEAQHQIDIQKSEYRQRLILVGLGLSSALLLVLAFFYRSKQSNNQHLKIANEDIQNKAQAIAESNEKLQTINEEIKAKSEIVENQRDSLAQTLQQLKSTQTQLVQAEKMASLGQLTAGIAHEINNPINFVSGNIVSVEANLQDIMEIVKAYEQTYPENEKIKQLKQDIYYQDSIDEMATLVAGIKEGAHRTAEIVKGLRTFSRLDEDELKEADLHENIDSTLMLLHSQYKDRIVIEKDYAPLPPIECYPGKLNQVLMNLLANAIQAIEGKGTIKIATILAADDQVLISIADSGKGMDAVTQQRIFEPFFTTKDVGKGTGLGLSIALGIVEAHRGTLEVESEVGRGTVFGLRLPLKVNT